MFDLRKYLEDNTLLKENLDEASKAKKDYLAREKRLEQGNWKDSVGQYVEKHGQDLESALRAGQLRNFVANNMKPELGPEAQEYLDNLLTTCKSPMKLLTALYNVTMKGSGLGLNEEVGEEAAVEYPDFEESAVEYLTSYFNDLIVGRYYNDCSKGSWVKNYPSSEEYPYGRIGCLIDGSRIFLGNESEDSESPLLICTRMDADGKAIWREVTESDAQRLVPRVDVDDFQLELFDSGRDLD